MKRLSVNWSTETNERPPDELAQSLNCFLFYTVCAVIHHPVMFVEGLELSLWCWTKSIRVNIRSVVCWVSVSRSSFPHTPLFLHCVVLPGVSQCSQCSQCSLSGLWSECFASTHWSWFWASSDRFEFFLLINKMAALNLQQTCPPAQAVTLWPFSFDGGFVSKQLLV